MYAILVGATLAIGSGDARGGATSERTVEIVPPYTLLREGLRAEKLQELLGKPDPKDGLPGFGGTLGDPGKKHIFQVRHYHVGPDAAGSYHLVTVSLEDDRVTAWKVVLETPSSTGKR